jgi:hypothetical protein
VCRYDEAERAAGAAVRETAAGARAAGVRVAELEEECAAAERRAARGGEDAAAAAATASSAVRLAEAAAVGPPYNTIPVVTHSLQSAWCVCVSQPLRL